jgi:hypothetical protein
MRQLKFLHTSTTLIFWRGLTWLLEADPDHGLLAMIVAMLFPQFLT